MAQYKNIGGRRYLKTTQTLSKSGAEKKAREYRVTIGLLARVVPDGHGFYDIYTAVHQKGGK